jgi:hypothetical protein
MHRKNPGGRFRPRPAFNAGMPSLGLKAAAGFGLLAAACVIAAVLLPASCGIEGAYFNRSTDAPAAAGNVVISGYGVCWAPDFLLGAAAAFAIAAAVMAALSWRLRRRVAS